MQEKCNQKPGAPVGTPGLASKDELHEQHIAHGAGGDAQQRAAPPPVQPRRHADGDDLRHPRPGRCELHPAQAVDQQRDHDGHGQDLAEVLHDLRHGAAAKQQPRQPALQKRARGADRLCSYGDWVALSDECDAQTATYLKYEVSDGIIAPSYSDEALEILKTKRKGGYTVIQIDPTYEPAPIERRNIFGITFEQGHNNLKIDENMLTNIVTENKELPKQAKLDMIVSLITLKYTQSNSVCYVKDGMTIGVGAGQQSRIHCTRLAGNKADNWMLRQHPKVLGLQFVDGIRRPDRDNAIDVFISDEYEDVLADGVWQTKFKVKPEPLTREEKKAWIATQSGVTVGSDAFFPFGDNVERAKKSGVAYIAQPGGSIRDDHVIDTCNKYGIVMSFTGIRLFHH